jgi:hypothetical protein
MISALAGAMMLSTKPSYIKRLRVVGVMRFRFWIAALNARQSFYPPDTNLIPQLLACTNSLRKPRFDQLDTFAVLSLVFSVVGFSPLDTSGAFLRLPLYFPLPKNILVPVFAPVLRTEVHILRSITHHLFLTTNVKELDGLKRARI